MLQKVGLYLENGSEACLVISPKSRKVTVYFPDGSTVEMREGESISFAGCTFGVTDLFEN